ncbi:phospho-sugar mutase [Faecalicoccus acidiformans]|uniref:phospho-sugar mutase n=1 Tax=Faecalicoccus acidiformans TaxID=915173 RepID=UPI002353AE92|nr:phospho-sugar mutase [Faecalicoccus acidiformans]
MTWESNYKKWIDFESLDPSLKKELLKMSQEDLQDAFYKDLEFGTGGLRALMGPGTNRLNIYTVRKITEGYSQWLIKQGSENYSRGIVIAYDNRYMSKEFAHEVAKVLAYHHIPSYIFDSLRPTPMLSYAVRKLKAFGGVVITASHNPPEYNGYKIYDETGCQCVPSKTNEIAKNIVNINDEIIENNVSNRDLLEFINIVPEFVDEEYYKEVWSIQLHPDLDKESLTIIYSPQHGTGNVPVNSVLKKANYNIIPVKCQSNPDPYFTNTRNPNPEDLDAFDEAIKVAKKTDATIILSTDPDCDRASVMVKHNGKYVLLTGNQIGVIILNYIIEEKRKNGTFPDNPVVLSTVVSSSLGELICDKNHVRFEKTLTGFKYIGERISKLNKASNFLFAYEESNGFLLNPSIRDKDGVQACLIIAEIANYYQHLDMTLIDALKQIYLRYGFFEDKLFTQKLITNTKNYINTFRKSIPTLIQSNEIAKIEDYESSIIYEKDKKSLLEYPKTNLIKIYYSNYSWMAIRPSGTEPKVKVYYCNCLEDDQ